MIVKTDPGVYRVPSLGLANGYATEGSTGSARKEQAVLIDHQDTIRLYKDDSGWAEVDPTSPVPTVNALARHPRLAFDEDARAVITYWQAAIYVKHASTLYGPYAGYDPVLVYDGDYAASPDVILFYLNKARDKVYYRLSSESYATEYLWYTFVSTPEVRLDQAHLIAGPKMQLCFTELSSATTYYLQSDTITLFADDFESYALGTPTGYWSASNTHFSGSGGASISIVSAALEASQAFKVTKNSSTGYLAFPATNSPSITDVNLTCLFRPVRVSGILTTQAGGLVARYQNSTSIGVGAFVKLDGDTLIYEHATQRGTTVNVGALTPNTDYLLEFDVVGSSATFRVKLASTEALIGSNSTTVSTYLSAGKTGLAGGGTNNVNAYPLMDDFKVIKP